MTAQQIVGALCPVIMVAVVVYMALVTRPWNIRQWVLERTWKRFTKCVDRLSPRMVK